MATLPRRSVLAAAGAATALLLLAGCTASGDTASEEAPAAEATVVNVTEDRVVTPSRLTADTAMVAAQAALAQCQADGLGFVSVSVVDRFGQLQAFVRGDNAAAHTIEASQQKAYTAAAFGTDTSDLVSRADALRDLPGTLFLAGGVSVKLGDASIAGIGVGGAPSGDADQACAAAGLAAISEDAES
ncbi:GlcG/HbpS family heme-binding protein [Microbacterium aurugineum]|uniref:GlcG/HbpS family heme-binding protein n=1 Tax=Microbacterium aurugineum TaxID=2851642 RepID=UPI0020BD67B1|nr:heme-binding protein [Microbacterium aurugineum]MCK8475668.1 heme-binding protein [Microbacterium aurugineum]